MPDRLASFGLPAAMRLAAAIRRATLGTPDPAGAIAQEIRGWFARESGGVRVFVAGELAGLAGEPDAAAEVRSFGGTLDGDKSYRVCCTRRPTCPRTPRAASRWSPPRSARR